MASSLAHLHALPLTIMLACVALTGYAGYGLQAWSVPPRQDPHAVRAALEGAAARLDDLLADQRLLLETIASQPATIAALERGSTAADRARRGAEIAALVPHARAATLVTAQAMQGAMLDEECLGYLRRAISAVDDLPAEFHALARDTEHYDLVRAVRDERGRVQGLLIVGFAAAPLRAMLESALAGTSGYAELWQITGNTAVTVATSGTALHAEPLFAVPVNRGHWSLVHRGARPPPILAGGWLDYPLHLAILVLALAGFGAAAYQLHRRTVRAVRHDIESLTRMFRDVREGNVRVDYPMRLKEFAEAFRYLRESGERLLKEKERLKDMGLIDHLSQLSNRRHLEMRLKELFELARSHGPSSVLIIDVDHFKSVNDRHGHDVGDALIVGFADALRKVVRQTDVLARLGGDEFCVLYPYAPLEKARAFAERLRRQLPREIPLGKGVVHELRWTGGLSVMTAKDRKFDEVLWRADQALIAAKEAGRNLTQVFDPEAGGVVRQRIVPS